MPTLCFWFTIVGYISGWKDMEWNEKENVSSDKILKSCEKIEKSSVRKWQRFHRLSFMKTNYLCVSLRNPMCKELTYFVLSISDLCHFLCLIEEYLIIRTNYSGRHPEPYNCSEVYCYYCSRILLITQSSRRQST